MEKCTTRENPGYAYEKRAPALRWYWAYRMLNQALVRHNMKHAENNKHTIGLKSLYSTTSLVFNSPDGGVPWDDLRKILPGCQQMASVPNGVETLAKISIAWVGRRTLQTDRRQTDGRPMTYSDREREFTFAKNQFMNAIGQLNRGTENTKRSLSTKEKTTISSHSSNSRISDTKRSTHH